MDSQGFTIILRLVIGSVLINAGIVKLRQLPTFVLGVLQYEILPIVLARWYGRLLPFIEIGIGVFLLLGIGFPLVAFLSTIVLFSFAIAVTINILRKRETPCYCFGADSSDKMGWHTLIRISLLLSATIALILLPVSPNLQALFELLLVGEFNNFIPVAFITVFGLLTLSFIEVSPLVIRAWTTQAVQPPQAHNVAVWTREAE